MHAISNFSQRMRPERAAGGFSRDDGTLDFYIRIDALVKHDMIVLDLGAGRGARFDDDTYVSRMSHLRGRVARLVGCDVDPVVMNNPGLDEAHVIEPSKPLPFANASFDLIYSDWVLEHIENPKGFAAEVDRILKPSGWFCARTPNKWGYIAMAARLSPEKIRSGVLKMLQPHRLEHDVFPKYYRMNTLAAIEESFPAGRFLHASHTGNPEPSYHGGRVWMYRLIELFQGLPLRTFDTVIFVFLQKSDSNASALAGRPKA